LEFTIELGTVGEKKVIKWNGVYNGKDGNDCDNFWEY
jgi:hypothetical protein